MTLRVERELKNTLQPQKHPMSPRTPGRPSGQKKKSSTCFRMAHVSSTSEPSSPGTRQPKLPPLSPTKCESDSVTNESHSPPISPLLVPEKWDFNWPYPSSSIAKENLKVNCDDNVRHSSTLWISG